MKKTACFVLGVICTLPAYAGKIATVDYVHDVLGDAGFNVAPNSASVGKIANMEYLLKMVDMANNSRGLTSVYGQTPYATGHIADTNAVDTVIGKYLKNTCPVGSYWVDRNRTECKQCPTDFTSMADTVGIGGCYISLPAGYMIKAGGDYGYYVHDCLAETERFCPGIKSLSWGTITSVGDMGVYDCPANSSTRSAQFESDWKYCTCDDGYSLDGTSSGSKKTQDAPCIKIEEQTCDANQYMEDGVCKNCPSGSVSDGKGKNIDSCIVTVTLSKNGGVGTIVTDMGTYTGATDAKLGVGWGALATLPSFAEDDLKSDYYHYDGTWGVDEDCTQKVSYASWLGEGHDVLTYYACRKGQSFTIGYDAGGGSGSRPVGFMCIYDSGDCLAPENTFVRDGYKFTHWLITSTTDDSYLDYELEPGEDMSYMVIPGVVPEELYHLVLTAQWEKVSLDTATLKANCVSGYGTWNDTTNKCTCTYPGTYELDSATGKCKPKANTTVVEDCAERGTWNADTYTCTCDTGYKWDGVLCNDVDTNCDKGKYFNTTLNSCEPCPGDFTSDGGMNGITSCYIDLGKGQVAVYGMVLPGVLETFDCTTDNSVFNFAEGYKTGYYCPGGRFYYSTSSNVYGFTQCHPLFRHGTSMISSADECQYKLTDLRKYVDNGDVVCGVNSTADYFGQIMLGNCGSLEVGGHTATYGDVCGGKEDGALGMISGKCIKDTATLKANCISGYGTWNDTTNKCTCTYPGTYELDSATGKCKPKANTSVAQDCAGRGTWNADTYTCTCDTGYKWDGALCNDFECKSGEYLDRGANACVTCPDGFTSNGGVNGITSCYVDLEKGQVAGYGLVFPGMMQRFNCTTDDTIINFDSSYETGYYCPGGRFYYSASSIIYGYKQCHPLFRHGTSMISSADECQYTLTDQSKFVDSAEAVCGATDDDDSFGQITLGNCPNDMVGGYTTTYGDVCGGREDGYLGGFSSSCY